MSQPSRMPGAPAALGASGSFHVLIHVPGRSRDYAASLEAVDGLHIRAAETPEDALSLSSWADIFCGAGLKPAILNVMPCLRWVQWVWAGVDSLMNDPAFSAALASGRIRLSRATGIFGEDMAEYVLGYCLCLAQRVPAVLEAQRRREWRKFHADVVRGRRMGVAGLGSIGGEVARAASRFGMTVSGLSRTGRTNLPLDRVHVAADFREFVRDLDYLVLTLPLTGATCGMVDRSVFEAMKPSAVLINIGRGAVVNQADLLQALKAGRPGWAVLDVFDEEPLPAESELWSLPNVIITPHIAGVTRREDMLPLFLENLARFRLGAPLIGEVDIRLGY